MLGGRLQRAKMLLHSQHNKLIFGILLLLTTVLFSVHTYVTVARYLRHEFHQIVTIAQKDSLPLPVVTLLLNSNRNPASLIKTKPISMNFSYSIDGEAVQPWAVVEYHDQTVNQHYVTINVIDSDTLYSMNLTYDDVREMWPLKTSSSNSLQSGINLFGNFNAVDFLESADSNGNADTITLAFSSFETDSLQSVVGVPYYQLLPCEAITISLSLEHHTLQDRADSPCRDDYPEELSQMLLKPMTPDVLYNGVFAPNLPYDQRTCESLCIAKYWLPKCGCYVAFSAWVYAGMPQNVSGCPEFGNNCTKDTLYITPTVKPEKTVAFIKSGTYFVASHIGVTKKS